MKLFRSAILASLALSVAILGSTPICALNAEHVTRLDPLELQTGDWFGSAVAVDDNTIVVGAYRDGENGYRAGAAYVFVRQAGEWVQQARLLAPGGEARDEFGATVATSGDTILVGARGDDDNGADAGAAYVFVRDGNSWVVQAKLTAPTPIPNQGFGIVAVDGNTAAIGAAEMSSLDDVPQGVYMFERGGNTWTLTKFLQRGEPYNLFGSSVAVRGDQLVVGAELDSIAGQGLHGAGSAYIFDRVDGDWVGGTWVHPEDGLEGENFGRDVDIDGDLMLGTCPLDFEGGYGSSRGAAYIYTRSVDGWNETVKLIALDATIGDRFGSSGALQEEVLLIGASRVDDLGFASGAAYLYARVDDEWYEQDKFHAIDGSEGDLFGESVDLAGSTIVVGAPGADDDAGAVYVYELTGPPVPATGGIAATLIVILVLCSGSYLLLSRRPRSTNRT